MSRNVRKRVGSLVNGGASNEMDVDIPRNKDGRVLRTRRSLPALSPTKSDASKSAAISSTTITITSKRGATAIPQRRHSSRVEILADRKKFEQQ